MATSHTSSEEKRFGASMPAKIPLSPDEDALKREGKPPEKRWERKSPSHNNGDKVEANLQRSARSKPTKTEDTQGAPISLPKDG
jgi:hypothetical protein